MTTDPKDAEIADLVAELTRAPGWPTLARRAVDTIKALVAERDAALAHVARLHHLIREASHPDFLWGAMDNVNDMDADITEFAKAASRAIQASIPDPDALSRRDAQMRAEGMREAAAICDRHSDEDVEQGCGDFVAHVLDRDAILAKIKEADHE